MVSFNDFYKLSQSLNAPSASLCAVGEMLVSIEMVLTSNSTFFPIKYFLLPSLATSYALFLVTNASRKASTSTGLLAVKK
jgi:hypothetical protein